MKRLLSLLVVMIVCINTFADNVKVGDIYYHLDKETGTAEVTSSGKKKGDNSEVYFPSYTGNVTIPSEIIVDGVSYSVTSIGDYAFYWCDELESVTIPSSVTVIGLCAFMKCEGLTSLVLQSGLKEIGNAAFRECTSLTSVTIPDGVTVIGNNAFFWCDALTSVTLPNSVTQIGESAFGDCENLKNCDVPSGAILKGTVIEGEYTNPFSGTPLVSKYHNRTTYR